jgi:type I restriction enzyme, S subunit
MKKGWQTKKLSAFYQIGSSKRVLKSQWKTEGVPFYRGREITLLAANGFVDNELFVSEKHYAELSEEYGVPKAGDIVITAIGTIGNAHVVRDSDRFYFKDASVLWMKRTAEVSSKLISFWLKSPLFFDQLDRGNGATVDTLTIQKLQSVEIDLPPPAEQQRIVGILDEAFEGLATAKANAEKNLRNACALFESHLQTVFTQRGPGWVETTIGDQVTFQRGFDITKEQQKAGDVPVVSSGGIKSFHDTSMAKAPGVVIGRKGTLGKVFYLSDNFWPHDTTLWVKDFKGNHPRFVYYFMRNLDVAHLDTGTANPALNRNVLHPIQITWPSVDLQPSLAAVFDKLESETQRLASVYERKLAALEALKKSLLHHAFTGQL